MSEIWKDIVGYEKIYQISNTRKIKRLKRMCNNKILHEKELSFSKNGKYDVVCLTKNGQSKNYYVDRLYYDHFEKRK